MRIDPEKAGALADGEGLHPDAGEIRGVMLREGRHVTAAAIRAEAPAVERAHQSLPVERPLRQGHAPVRAAITEGEERPVLAAADHHLLAVQRDGPQATARQAVGPADAVPRARQRLAHRLGIEGRLIGWARWRNLNVHGRITMEDGSLPAVLPPNRNGGKNSTGAGANGRRPTLHKPHRAAYLVSPATNERR